MRRYHRRSIFILPWLYVLVAIVLGIAMPHFKARPLPLLAIAPLHPDVAIAILSAASTGMMALTGVVFALAGIFITFGTTAYTPRLVSAFTDRTLIHAIGIFTGSFLYMLIALRAVYYARNIGPVNATPALIAIVWIIASVYMLFRLVIRTWTMNESVVLATLGAAGLQAIRRMYPTPYISEDKAAASSPQTARMQSVVYHGNPLYIRRYDVTSLVALSHAADAVIRLPHAIGDAFIDGDLLAMVYGRHPVPETQLQQAIEVDQDRSIQTDPMYAMRLLVDIAIRALSPAINDPTTAVEALDKIEALLRTLGTADLQIGRVCDAAGIVRLVYPVPMWEEYLNLGILQILHYGADSVQVQRRIGMLLHSLKATTPEARHAAVERLASERFAIVRRVFPDTYERLTAEAEDRQGLGQTWVE